VGQQFLDKMSLYIIGTLHSIKGPGVEETPMNLPPDLYAT